MSSGQRTAYLCDGDVETHHDADHGLRLRCPQCRSDRMAGLQCPMCGFVMKSRGGVYAALSDVRKKYYATFIREYELIREAEGRGSDSAEYYLELPYRDASGRNYDQWAIRATSFEYLMRTILGEGDRQARVLDLGAGNCWLSYRLAQRGYRPVAVDLLTNMRDGLGAAVHYETELGVTIPRFQAALPCLPFQSNQFDAAIFNASFHYAEDYDSVLQEALRCLKPGGSLVICDTPWYPHEEDGKQMLAERRVHFQEHYQTASDSIKSQEYLTDERLQRLAHACSIQWKVYRPWYGWRWAIRPWIARYHHRRRPSQFRMYVAIKPGMHSAVDVG